MTPTSYRVLISVLVISAFNFLIGTASAKMMQVINISDGDTLNVRSRPSSFSADIGDLNSNQIINVLKFNSKGTWAQIRYHGKRAWVSTKYLADVVRSDGSSVSTGAHVVTGIRADDPDGGLIVRAGAGKNFAPINALRNNTLVHVIQRNREGTWAMIRSQDGVGWVSTRYLTSQRNLNQPSASFDPYVAPDGGPLPAVFAVTGIASNDRLWVRDSPQTTGNRLGGLRLGSMVSVNGRVMGNWVQITLNGQIGYVNSLYLTRR